MVNYGFNSPGASNSALSLYINGSENANTRLALLDEGHVAGSILLTLTGGSTVSMGVSVLAENVVLPGNALNAYIVLVPVYA